MSGEAATTVRLIEVGARDGLQNEAQKLDTATKLTLIDRLARAGLRAIEATSFVSPHWIPQMADHEALMRALVMRPGVQYPVLTPNLRGFEGAVAAGAKHVAVFASASESFSKKNINCTIEQSFARFAPVFEAAHRQGIGVRGYVSCVIACPYDGPIAPARAAEVAQRLHDAGCYEVSLGDTIGVGTPTTVLRMLDAVGQRVPLAKLAGHFHDTYGMAVANVYASYEHGLRAFDSSVGGLGGCPYAKGATGNVATEDLVYLFETSGIRTGVDPSALRECAAWINGKLGRQARARGAPQH